MVGWEIWLPSTTTASDNSCCYCCQVDPVMTCYKLVTAEFKWFGFQGKVENFIQKSERRLFTNFHRYLPMTQMFVVSVSSWGVLQAGVLLDGRLARAHHGGHPRDWGADSKRVRPGKSSLKLVMVSSSSYIPKIFKYSENKCSPTSL